MLFSKSTIAAGLVALQTLPSTLALLEEKPWKLSNIVAYQSNSEGESYYNNYQPSRITFAFKDENKGIQLSTTCDRTVKKGEKLFDGETYPCAKDNVSFSINANQTISIQRSYKDPSVGEPPYDIVTCFGNWGANLHPEEKKLPRGSGGVIGTKYTQGCLEIYCTSAIA